MNYIIFRFLFIFFLGTFKVKKTIFQDDGYDLKRIQEPVYYLNQQKQTYEQLTFDIYDLIQQGKIKF